MKRPGSQLRAYAFPVLLVEEGLRQRPDLERRTVLPPSGTTAWIATDAFTKGHCFRLLIPVQARRSSYGGFAIGVLFQSFEGESQAFNLVLHERLFMPLNP